MRWWAVGPDGPEGELRSLRTITEGSIMGIGPDGFVIGIATQPLTHAERRSYAAMKRHVAGRAAVGLVVQVPPYTMVEVKYAWEPGKYIVRHGFSKWNPNDADDPRYDWDADKGVKFARGRAVAAIARELMANSSHGFETARPEDMAKFASWTETETKPKTIRKYECRGCGQVVAPVLEEERPICPNCHYLIDTSVWPISGQQFDYADNANGQAEGE